MTTSMHLSEVVERFTAHQHRFTRRQWRTLVLFFQEGLTQEEIAVRLGCGRSAISARLKRAKAMMDQIQKELRREAVEATRRLAEEGGSEHSAQ